MNIRIEKCTSSIADCVDTVKQLHLDGVAKEHLSVVTNIASRDTITNNYNLRRNDGSIFSAHSLLTNINELLTLAEFEKKNPSEAFLEDYKERIESGSMVIIVQP